METTEGGLRVFRLYAECKTGTNFKFYQCEVRETEQGKGQFTVNFGRIGTDGQTKDHGVFATYDYAKSKAQTQFQTKLDKGYVKTDPLQALASTMLGPEDLMNSRGYEPIEVDIPAWDTGSPRIDEQLTNAARKVIEKLNLVRSSRSEYKQRGHISSEKYWAELGRVHESWRTSCWRIFESPHAKKFYTAEHYDKIEKLNKILRDKFGVRRS